MRVELDIDDSLFKECLERRLDIKTFLEVKLYEFFSGLENFCQSRDLSYREIKIDFEKWLYSRISEETARKYLKLLRTMDTITVEAIRKGYETTTDRGNYSKAVRNLINFILERGMISRIQAEEMKKAVPLRKSNSDRIVPTDSDILEAFHHYMTLRKELQLIAKLLLYSGARLRHILRMLSELDRRRIIVRGNFARYEIEHTAKGRKHAFVIYFPAELVKELKRIRISENTCKDVLNFKASSGRTVSPKYIRKWFNNVLVRLRIEKDIRNFILGRPGDISKSTEADNYLELLNHADEVYPAVLEYVSKICPVSKNCPRQFHTQHTLAIN